jgi:hypothetical protein
MRKRFWMLVGLAGLITLAACGPVAVASPTAGAVPAEASTPVLPSTQPPPLTPTPTPVPPTDPAPTPSVPLPTPSPSGAGNADVRFVRAVEAPDGTWTFHVTVEHPDTGWEDYADGWDVVTPDGTVLKPDPDSPFTRLLLHPHENEQPFTRSQSGLVIPHGVTQVRVRAHDLVDGYGGREVGVDLTVASGPDFEVERTP